MSRMEIFSGVERRRRWSVEEKRRLVSAAFAPGAVVSEVARRADIHPNQLYRWRKELGSFPAGFAEVVVAGDLSGAALSCASAFASAGSGAPPDADDQSVIEIAFADRRLRLPVSTSPALASAVIGALVRR